MFTTDWFKYEPKLVWGGGGRTVESQEVGETSVQTHKLVVPASNSLPCIAQLWATNCSAQTTAISDITGVGWYQGLLSPWWCISGHFCTQLKKQWQIQGGKGV